MTMPLLPGPQGERGRMGDHGQDGIQGETGETGPTGKTGAPAPSTTRRLLILYVVLVVAAVLYGLRLQALVNQVQTNSDNIGQVLQEARYEGCLAGVESVRFFNGLQENLADIDRRIADLASTPETEALIRERVALYERGVFPLPDCRELKP